jgi:hypothetical protein
MGVPARQDARRSRFLRPVARGGADPVRARVVMTVAVDGGHRISYRS